MILHKREGWEGTPQPSPARKSSYDWKRGVFRITLLNTTRVWRRDEEMKTLG